MWLKETFWTEYYLFQPVDTIIFATFVKPSLKMVLQWGGLFAATLGGWYASVRHFPAFLSLCQIFM